MLTGLWRAADCRLMRLHGRIPAQALALTTVATGLAYLTWLTGAIDWGHPIIGLTLVAAEGGALGVFVLVSTAAWRRRDESAVLPLPSSSASVDVLVTTCGEPLAVIAGTLDAAKAVRWAGLTTIHVLDDKGDPGVEALAHQAGMRYLSRPKDGAGSRDDKAGNLNYGLARSCGEYVLTLDADQAPAPDILERLAPYLAVPRTAFVQSRQQFHVPEGDPFYCQDLVLYNTLQPAFDAHGMVLSRGSGVLYRRQALDENGGFSTWNLVEDFTTSYELHSRGWTSVYCPHALSIGLAPDTLSGVCRQRAQWAFDAMRLFWWRNPLRQRGLTRRQRLNYGLIGGACLVAGCLVPPFYLIPVWAYATGESALAGREIDFAIWRTLYGLVMAISVRWLFRHDRPGRQFQMLVGLFPVYAWAAVRALGYPRSKPAYAVNHQAAPAERWEWTPLVTLMPQLAVVIANVIGPVYALWRGAGADVVVAHAGISAMAVWSLSHVCLAAFDRHHVKAERDSAGFHVLSARH